MDLLKENHADVYVLYSEEPYRCVAKRFDRVKWESAIDAGRNCVCDEQRKRKNLKSGSQIQ